VFIHLNTHSHFSLLEALPSPEELVKAAADAGMPAVALTDHNLLSGAVEFQLACRKYGIQPIIGLELDVAGEFHSAPVILLATGAVGWSNLCRISSSLHLREDPDAPVSTELLEGNSAELVVICGSFGDPGGKTLEPIAEMFPQRTYVALRTDREGGSYSTTKLAKQMNLPVVAIHPVRLLTPEEAPLLRTLAAIQQNCTIKGLPRQRSISVPPSFMRNEEMLEHFREDPAAIAATQEIAERCRFSLPLGVPHLPRVPIPKGMTPQQALRQKAELGAKRLYTKMTPAIQERLDHELEVIASKGFEPVFLIVEELLHFARENNVPFSSRGSAGSSLVAHCLGITSPDPLHHNLYFERFLNPARITPPDIDTDLCSRRRDLVIQHVFKEYGAERVAMVGTINRFRPRSALGDVAKAFGVEPSQARELTATLPYGFFARRDAEEDEGKIPESPFSALAARFPSPEYKKIFKHADALLKQPRHLSVHAGGLVIAPEAMTDLVPVMRSGSKGVIITQLDLHSVEALGLVKIDLLGIRGLTVMGDVADAVYSWRRKDYSSPREVLESVPGVDEETSDRLEKGLTIGCFQIESPGMRATLREIHARTPDDLIVALSLYRPGPITGGMKDDFVRRFKGEETTVYLHPALEPVLKETYGVVLYQEQVLRIARDLAGMSLMDADLLRRAMSHFDPGRQMQLLKERFVQGALEKSAIPADVSERVWELMAAFAGYGFPKAHAASYAQVSWRSAWCKTHFPAEFMAAVMANWGGYYSQRVYLMEARRLGLKVHAPHINHSRREFGVAYPNGEAVLYMGLDQVRDLTGRTMERIQQMHPFRSLEEFMTKVDPRKQEAENLIKVGALEGLGAIPELLHQTDGGTWRPGQMSLFTQAAAETSDWSIDEKVEAQQELLGVSVLAHPLDLVARQVQEANAISTVEAVEKMGQRVTVAGMRMNSHRHKNSKGEWMLFLTLEDLEGMLETIVMPDVYRTVKDTMFTSQPMLLTGTMEIDGSRGEPMLRVEKVEVIR
jgi:DNA polymerase-3 subunit alpha